MVEIEHFQERVNGKRLFPPIRYSVSPE